MYFKEFEIRWSDTDANGHLANAGYVNFMSHTCMSYMIENGLGLPDLMKYQIGPVVFNENIFYFKEVFLGNAVKVSLQLRGLSADGMFFEFLHNFYDQNGRNCARCLMLGAWIDLKSRKLSGLPAELYEKLDGMERTDDFRILTKENTRKDAQIPEDLDVRATSG